MIPCVFKVDAKGLAYLDQMEASKTASKSHRDHMMERQFGTLHAGSKVDVPLWLGIALA